jgi:hypothetical protein
MKKLIMTVLMTSLVMTLGVTSYSAEKGSKERFEDRAHSLNDAVKKNHAETEALHGISVETGVPMEKLRAMHENNPLAGPAGLMIACTIADETKKDPTTYVHTFVSGKSWTSIAEDNHVPFAKIEARLARLETYIRSGGDEKRPRH